LSSNSDLENKPESSKPKNKENLKQRAYLNSVTSVLDYGARVITGFVITPFLVSGLGSTLFGVWKVIGQFTNYANLADIKATQVLKWAVAKDRDSVNKEELREYVTATFILVMCILPLILVAGSIIVWFSPQITGVESEYYEIVRITTALLIFALIIHKVFDVFESILRGMNLGFKRMGFRAGVFVFGGGLQVAAMLLGYGLIVLATIQILINFIIGITIYLIVKKHVPWFGFGKVRIKKSLSFFKTSGWFMIWNVVSVLMNNSDKMLLGYFAGPVLVTQYVITEYLIKAVRGIINNVLHGVKPGLGKLYGNSDFSKLLKIRSEILNIAWLLTLSISFVVLMVNHSFISTWIGREEFAGQLVNLLVIIMVAQLIFIQVDVSFISMTLDIKSRVYIGICSVVITIMLSVILIDKYEIIGLCISFIVGRSILNISYPYIVYRKFKQKSISLSVPIRKLVLTVALIAIAYNFSTYVTIEGWSEVIAYSGISFMITLIISFYMGIEGHVRSSILEYFYKIKLFRIDN